MDEPVLEIDDIQGNVIPGFGSPQQLLVAAEVNNAAQAHQALGKLARFVTSAQTVIEEKRQNVSSVWLNVVFSAMGLRLCFGDEAAQAIESLDDPFRIGMDAQAFGLGDPRDLLVDGKPNPGHRDNWVVGGTNTEVHLMFILACRTESELISTENWLFGSITGMNVLYAERGAALPGSKEHFGFRDGISHPGVRGKLNEHEFLTPRQLENGLTDGPEFSRPGQPLVWPGQFVFGYPPQQSSDPRQPDRIPYVPAFAKNGSFMVFRRLTQKVGEFFADTDAIAAELKQTHQIEELSGDLLRAKIVGRWPSGASISRSPNADPGIAGDDPAINHFTFRLPSLDVRLLSGETITGVPADNDGLVCPKFAHIRKVNPRDATHDGGGGETGTLTKRILRRGIPFGPRYNQVDKNDVTNQVERGLLFISFQTSIEDQFKFLNGTWMNNPAAPENQPGHDLLVGQKSGFRPRERRAGLLTGQGKFPVATLNQWVVPTGGGYFFAPAISQLTGLSSAKELA